MSTHRIARHMSADGFVASCSTCTWRTTRRTRELREQDVDAHELQPAIDLNHYQPTERNIT